MNHTKKTKARFKYVTESQKLLFKNACCVLSISVGQDVHEGRLFELTTELINGSFASCNILVDDTLQRYTMAMLKNGQITNYKDIAIKNGDLWLQRNEKYIQAMNIPTKIFRYNHWLSHPKFHACHSKNVELLLSNSTFRNIFEKTRDQFIEKYSSRNQCHGVPIHHLKELSMGYLIEECTTYCLLVELKCQFKIHPGIRNAARDATRDYLIAPSYPDLLHHVGISFKNSTRHYLLTLHYSFLKQ